MATRVKNILIRRGPHGPRAHPATDEECEGQRKLSKKVYIETSSGSMSYATRDMRANDAQESKKSKSKRG